MQYRKPELKEFVQDFEFEYLQTIGGGSFFFIDSNTDNNNIAEQLLKNRQPEQNKWVPMKVFWLNEDWIDCGNFVYKLHSVIDCPINLKWALDNNKIRTKIKEHE